MKKKWPDSVMAERRSDRLRHLNFFMTDLRVPPKAVDVFARSACLDLLTGWFQNSMWATAWFVLKYAASDSWTGLVIALQIFWHRRVMRRSREEMEKAICGDDEPEGVEEEWPDEVKL